MPPPYRVPFVDYRRQYVELKAELDAAIQRTLGEGNLILRDDVSNFEEQLANFIGVRHAVGLNSCTDALIFSLRAAGIGAGDEVITVAHTFVATIEAIVHAGATPVIVDVRDDYLMDMSAFEKAITPKTRAVIPVHLNGRVCDMQLCLAIAKKHKIVVIEDAAQALGATVDGQRSGSFGLTACFSFYPAKLLGAAGDAGAICTNDPDIAHTVRLLRDHGREGKTRHVSYGFTSRLDNLQAAVLNAKFPSVPKWIERRRELARIYDTGLADVRGVHPAPLPDDRHCDVYQNYVVRAERRDELAAHLRASGIEVIISNPIPVHMHPELGLTAFALPVTTRLAAEVISLPLIPELEHAQIDHVVSTIRAFYA
ncbi:MAG: DegT/DnrJ/EryC1/StrS family aminotransferase [Actinobacteria bacterium]|nr:DegT/DnrJ/EryC1/StrS family aminotransferase [Actinomycetota bacterium]